MRRKEKEITKREDIEKVIRICRVCRLAMVDGDRPYIVPLNFGYREGILYFHSAPEGKKMDLIKKNGNVCFEMDQEIKMKKASVACEWGIEYKSVIGSGRTQFLNTPEEKIMGLDIIMSQYSDRKFEYPDEMLEKTMVIKVIIEQMTGKQS